jgi:hypothetical protein
VGRANKAPHKESIQEGKFLKRQLPPKKLALKRVRRNPWRKCGLKLSHSALPCIEAANEQADFLRQEALAFLITENADFPLYLPAVEGTANQDGIEIFR